MAKKIYLGRMLEAVQTDMTTMSGDMASMVSELIALKTNMAQGISTINVASGNDKTVNLGNAEFTVTGSTLTSTGIKANFRCDGVVKFVCELKTSDTRIITLSYKIDGGGEVALGTITGGPYQELSGNISVKAGNNIEFFINGNNAGAVNYINAGALFKYNIKDIVNDGAITTI